MNGDSVTVAARYVVVAMRAVPPFAKWALRASQKSFMVRYKVLAMKTGCQARTASPPYCRTSKQRVGTDFQYFRTIRARVTPSPTNSGHKEATVRELTKEYRPSQSLIAARRRQARDRLLSASKATFEPPWVPLRHAEPLETG